MGLKLSYGLRIITVTLFAFFVVVYIYGQNWPAVAGWLLALLFAVDDIIKRPLKAVNIKDKPLKGISEFR